MGKIYTIIMIDIVIQKSSNPKKKYDAIFNGGKTISFGANGYSDFILSKGDEMKRKNYINRHKKEDWTRGNVESAAWLSRWILWEKSSLREAIQHANKMYKDVKIKLK